MTKPKIATLRKPTLPVGEVLRFAESGARAAPASKSGLVPEGDVRLTANIRADLHMALKIRAAKERTTVGELIEQWVAGWKD